MKLLVDVGNSSIKWCIEREGLLHEYRSFPYDISNLDNQLEVEWSKFNKPLRIIISNVAGTSIQEQINNICNKLWKMLPEYISVSARACGVNNGYRDVRQLGTDRWAAVIATWQLYKRAACVVDCGTAMTIDAISPDGKYMGGIIAPGVELMQCSLSVQTDALNLVKNRQVIKEFSDNTGQGQYSGCTLAIVVLIDYMFNHIRTVYGNDLVGVASGSGFSLIKDSLKNKFEYYEDLVLKGLSCLSGDCS